MKDFVELTYIKQIEQIVWLDGKPVCPKCDFSRSYNLAQKSVYKCCHCGFIYNVKSATHLKSNKIKLSLWFNIINILCECKGKITTHGLAKRVGVTQKTAWGIKRRLIAAVEYNPTFDYVLKQLLFQTHELQKSKGLRKLTNKDVVSIRNKANNCIKAIKVLAIEYNIDSSNVAKICRGLSYKDAGGPIVKIKDKICFTCKKNIPIRYFKSDGDVRAKICDFCIKDVKKQEFKKKQQQLREKQEDYLNNPNSIKLPVEWIDTVVEKPAKEFWIFDYSRGVFIGLNERLCGGCGKFKDVSFFKSSAKCIVCESRPLWILKPPYPKRFFANAEERKRLLFQNERVRKLSPEQIEVINQKKRDREEKQIERRRVKLAEQAKKRRERNKLKRKLKKEREEEKSLLYQEQLAIKRIKQQEKLAIKLANRHKKLNDEINEQYEKDLLIKANIIKTDPIKSVTSSKWARLLTEE